MDATRSMASDGCVARLAGLRSVGDAAQPCNQQTRKKWSMDIYKTLFRRNESRHNHNSERLQKDKFSMNRT
jgi:hypothetical protein